MNIIKEYWMDAVKLCKGDPEDLADLLKPKNNRKVIPCIFWIIIGSSFYGTSIGIWRAPLQAVYVSVKFPLLIFLTTLGNLLLNGILAQVLGAKISFRQSSLAILMSFSIAAIILGSLTPLTLMLIFNSPPMGSEHANNAYQIIVISNVTIIAFAGISANLRLMYLLKFITKSEKQAKAVLFSWLAGNLLLGTQLSWIMRPFIGNPHYSVVFFRKEALNGNFFEALFSCFQQLMS